MAIAFGADDANARLIAAAPGLLAAARAALDAFDALALAGRDSLAGYRARALLRAAVTMAEPPEDTAHA